jgi:hypothetical protein
LRSQSPFIYKKQKARGEKGPRRLLYLHQFNCLAGQEVETGAQFVSQLAAGGVVPIPAAVIGFALRRAGGLL